MPPTVSRSLGDLRALTGIVVATPTALTADGKVDRQAAAALARELVDAGAAGLAPLGGTGEIAALSATQRRDMLEATVEAVGGKVPIVAGVVTPGIGDAVDHAKAALAAGANGIMLITPFFQRPTQDGIVDYYKAFSDRVDADICLYELPYRTGIALTPDTVQRLAEQTRCTSMKACNPDMVQFNGLMAAAGDKMTVLSGDEDLMPLHVGLGAQGALLASAVIFPRLWGEVLRLGREGNYAESVALHREMQPALAALFAEHNPAPIKAALTQMGRSNGEVITPLRPASAPLRERLAQILPSILAKETALAKAPQRKTA